MEFGEIAGFEPDRTTKLETYRRREVRQLSSEKSSRDQESFWTQRETIQDYNNSYFLDRMRKLFKFVRKFQKEPSNYNSCMASVLLRTEGLGYENMTKQIKKKLSFQRITGKSTFVEAYQKL